MKQVFLLVLLLLQGSLIFSQYPIGQMSASVTDPTRTDFLGNDRNITYEIYYPATSQGAATSAADGDFPLIVFGHGFGMAWSEYEVWWNALVPQGYILVFPTTENSIIPFPSHEDFAKDMAFLIDYFLAENQNVSSHFYTKINHRTALMGHSMGGGCSFLATQYTSKPVRTVINLAAADTDPSAIAMASGISHNTLVIAGSADCVVQQGGTPLDLYQALTSTPYKAYIEITGASHCQFGIASPNSICTLGEFCSDFMPIASQHEEMLKAATPWLDYHLKGQCTRGTTFLAHLQTSQAHSFLESGTLDTNAPNASLDFDGNVLNASPSDLPDDNYFWYLNEEYQMALQGLGSTIIPSVSGDYSVLVETDNGCLDTSALVEVILTSIENVLGTGGTVFSFENKITLTHSNSSNPSYYLQLLGYNGKIIDEVVLEGSMQYSWYPTLRSEGIYLLSISKDNHRYTKLLWLSE